MVLIMISIVLLVSLQILAQESQIDSLEFFNVPNDEITLVWEHSCIKHLQKGEIQRARQNKETIDWQRAEKQYVTVGKEDLMEIKKYLEEAKLAKAKMGDAWKCNPAPEKLRIVNLKIGMDNNDSMPPETFVSNNVKNIAIEGKVEILENCKECRVEWKSSFPKNEANAVALTNQTDVKYLHSLVPAPQADRGDAFKAVISAALFGGDGKLDEAVYEIKQDEQDQLRQEYIDMEKKIVPKREELRDLGKTEHFSIEEFNTSEKAEGGRYLYILCKILPSLEQVKNRSGNIAMKINSGFRNPYKNGQLHNSAKESSHLYGIAVDIDWTDFNGDGKVDAKDRQLVVKSAKSAGACIEPEDGVRRIHMDWRGQCPVGW